MTLKYKNEYSKQQATYFSHNEYLIENILFLHITILFLIIDFQSIFYHIQFIFVYCYLIKKSISFNEFEYSKKLRHHVRS